MPTTLMKGAGLMAARATPRRRILLLWAAAGVVFGVAFVLLDIIVDVTVFGEGPLSANLGRPTEIWVRFASIVVAVAAAVAYGRLMIARDDAAEASRRYRTLAESARDDIFIVDSDRRISYMNTHAAREWGREPGDLVGKQLSELFPSEEMEGPRADLQRAFEGSEAYSELEFSFPSGRKWLSTRLVPLASASGRVDSVLGISRDITGSRRAMALSDALGRINEVVHSRLSVDEILSAISVEAAVAVGADSSLVMMCEGDDWVVRLAYGYSPEFVGQRLAPTQAVVAERVAVSRSAVCLNDATSDPRVDPETIARFGIKSLLAVPLTSRQHVIGALLFTERGKRICFTPDIIDFAARVASTVSLALDNARLYEEQRNVADSLQAAILLLPETLPGVEFAHEYRSATEAARVGGDFYDLFELDGGRVGITIGDISGHGIDAAVLTSLMKNAARIECTQEHRPPHEVVASANKLLLESSSPEIFATVFFGVLDLEDGRLDYCSAGHTTGVICCGPGCLRPLPANSPLAGALAEVRFELSTEHVAPDEVLFLYTDGLTEARRDGADLYGEERLFERLAERSGEPPADVIRDVMASVLAFSGNRLRDDLAILSLQRAPVREARAEVVSGSASTRRG